MREHCFRYQIYFIPYAALSDVLQTGPPFHRIPGTHTGLLTLIPFVFTIHTGYNGVPIITLLPTTNINMRLVVYYPSLNIHLLHARH